MWDLQVGKKPVLLSWSEMQYSIQTMYFFYVFAEKKGLSSEICA